MLTLRTMCVCVCARAHACVRVCACASYTYLLNIYVNCVYLVIIIYIITCHWEALRAHFEMRCLVSFHCYHFIIIIIYCHNFAVPSRYFFPFYTGLRMVCLFVCLPIACLTVCVPILPRRLAEHLNSIIDLPLAPILSINCLGRFKVVLIAM